MKQNNVPQETSRILHNAIDSTRKSKMFSSPMDRIEHASNTLLSQSRKLRATTAKTRNSANIRSLTRITKSGSNNEIISKYNISLSFSF